MSAILDWVSDGRTGAYIRSFSISHFPVFHCYLFSFHLLCIEFHFWLYFLLWIANRSKLQVLFCYSGHFSLKGTVGRLNKLERIIFHGTNVLLQWRISFSDVDLKSFNFPKSQFYALSVLLKTLVRLSILANFAMQIPARFSWTWYGSSKRLPVSAERLNFVDLYNDIKNRKSTETADLKENVLELCREMMFTFRKVHTLYLAPMIWTGSQMQELLGPLRIAWKPRLAEKLPRWREDVFPHSKCAQQ